MPVGRDGSVPKQTWRRRGFRLFALIVATVLILLAVLAFILYPTFKSYPTVTFPAAASLSDKNRQDLAYLRRLPEVERSFTAETRAAFVHAVDTIERRAPDLDKAGLTMAVARAVALADNGHTNVGGIVGDYGFNAVPFRLGWFDDGLFVVAAANEQRHLLGAQILGANGRTTTALVEALRPYVGGPANLAKEFVPNFMISPEILHAAGLAQSARASIYEMRLTDERVISVELAAIAATQAPLSGLFWPKRELSPIAQSTRPGLWRHVLDGVPLPAYLSRPDTNYWHDYPRHDLLYVQINRVSDQSPTGLSQYLSEILDEAEAKSIHNAIVDLRFNSGGDYLLTTDFTRRLPTLLPPGGSLYILTSANTFSAGISTVARLKYFGGSRAIIVGEAVGDRGQFWGEGGRTLLPNSRIGVRYTTAYHDWQRGCSLSEITTCFFLNYIYAVPAGALVPTVEVAPTFADYAAGKDAVMSEVMRLLATGVAH